MLRDDMIMKKAIVHILDSRMGMPVLSDCELDLGSDLCDFFKAHIEKFTESDEVKRCQFSGDSEVMQAVRSCGPENFVEVSKQLAGILFAIMNENIDIPPADIAVVVFGCEGVDYFGLLKMNYKSSYTHVTKAMDEGNSNDIILQKAILPSEGQKLSEAFVVNLENGEILLAEKKYEVNGAKEYYFSERFIKCHAPMSQKTKLDIVTKAVEQVNKKYYGDDDVDRKMEIKSTIYQELEEQGNLNVETVKEKLFSEDPQMQEEFQEKLEKYNMAEEIIEPKAQQTVRKFQKQHLTTDTGIEITIPMEQYQNAECVEFITNEDGTVSVLIKNIGKLTAK